MSDLGKLFSVSLTGITIARDRVKKKIEKRTDKEFIKVVNDTKSQQCRCDPNGSSKA